MNNQDLKILTKDNKIITLKELFEGKQAARKIMAKLSFEDKIKALINLQKLAYSWGGKKDVIMWKTGPEGSGLEEILKAVVQRIKSAYQPEKIILYGSYAYGNPDEGSDIDLLVIKDTDERPIDRRVTVRRLISDLRHGYPFSSIVITPGEINKRLEIGDQFFQEILSKGRVLYGRR